VIGAVTDHTSSHAAARAGPLRQAFPAFLAGAGPAPVGTPWMWTLAFGHHEDRTPTHGYAATREAAMVAFAKSWRRV